MEIRLALESDAETLAQLKLSYAEDLYRELLGEPDWDLWRKRWCVPAAFRASMWRGNRYYILEQEDELAAIAGLCPLGVEWDSNNSIRHRRECAGTPLLTSFYACSPGRGYGLLLLNHLIKQARILSTRAPYMHAWTFTSNERAAIFFGRHGFLSAEHEQDQRLVLWRRAL